jgi:hypothetical protein
MERKQLITDMIMLSEVADVPPALRGAVLAGQVAAYLAGAVLEMGATVEDIRQVAAFLAPAGDVAVGCHVTFAHGDGTPWDWAIGTLVDPDDMAGIVAVVSNAMPRTQPYMFPLLASDMVPITCEELPAEAVDAQGNLARVMRRKLTFTVAGKQVVAANLGTNSEHVFQIHKIL